MKISIIGTRGIPPRYGGFETFAAELSTRLVERGHAVTVYCRSSLYSAEAPTWRGVSRVELPAVRHKYLETVSHSLFSTFHALRDRPEVVLVCNAANAFVLPLLRAARIPAVINVDGIERRRRKWNALGRGVYLFGESLSASMSSAVVADADVIARYYEERYDTFPAVLPYGSGLAPERSDILDRLALRPREYVLYVSRFEPENNPLGVVEGWRNVESDLPLVMVGDAPYSKELIVQLHRVADERVLFPGALYGADYATLQDNALLYVQATEVGGTHPALIEAMASGGAVLANDTPENREAGGDAVIYFKFFEDDRGFARVAQEALDAPEKLEELRERARRRASEKYDWEQVTTGYEELFRSIVVAG